MFSQITSMLWSACDSAFDFATDIYSSLGLSFVAVATAMIVIGVVISSLLKPMIGGISSDTAQSARKSYERKKGK